MREVTDMATTAKTNGSAPAISTKIPAVAQPLAAEPSEIASNINYHAQYSPHFSPFKFEPEQAYYATAESVRDRLIQVRLLEPKFIDICIFFSVCFFDIRFSCYFLCYTFIGKVICVVIYLIWLHNAYIFIAFIFLESHFLCLEMSNEL